MTAERRFWAGAAGLVLLVLAAAGLVVLRGSTVGIGVGTSPEPGVTTSGRARVVLRFPTAMGRESVEERLTVAPAGGGAAVAGSWSWEEGGLRSERTAQFLPAVPLAPGTVYRATLRSGARAVNGRTVNAETAWTFTVRAPSLVFLRADATGGARQLWRADADGGNARQITREPGGVREFSPAPEGDRFAYTTQEGPQMTALWTVRADGTGRTRLSPVGDVFGYAAPAWSPAGDVIVYVLRAIVPGTVAANGAVTLGNSKLWAVAPDGRRLGRIYGRGDEVGFAPAWSPDGTHLAFREQVDAQNASAVVISDFTTAMPVAAGPGTRIAWSPDGTHLAYDETTPGAGGDVRSRVVIVRADGTGPRPLFGAGAGAEAAPDWSPDGTRLAFARRTQGADGSPTVEVWTATADGGDARRLFGGDGLMAAEPAWSPDGRTLVATRFNGRTGEDRGLWRVGADGAGAKLLVPGGERAVWVA